MANEAWHTRSVESVIAALSPARAGLSGDEVDERRAKAGFNELDRAPPIPAWRRLLAQLADITVLTLLAAAVIALVLGQLEEGLDPIARYGDAAAIALIVMLNAFIGFAQERRAEAALAALEAGSAPTARVWREGREQRIAARDLVPGDRVLIEEGDRIPADLRLIDSTDLAVAEAALTGESQPVDKRAHDELAEDTPLAERTNLAFSSTHVTRGKATGVVVATGMETAIGEIAGLLQRVSVPETPLSKQLQRFGFYVVIACVVIAIVVFALASLRGQADMRTAFLTAVSVAVAAIPEGLPAVTTIVLALGVQRMAKRQALVRRLAAVETLGGVRVICTDKTGTLTQNRMTVRRLGTLRHELTVHGAGPGAERARFVDGEEQVEREPHEDVMAVLRAARFAPAARLSQAEQGDVQVLGDPTDGALLLLARASIRPGAETPLPKRENPFDAARKLASVVAEEDGHCAVYAHGAPEAVLGRCTRIREAGQDRDLDDELRQQLTATMERWAGLGLRLLGLAEKTLPGYPEEKTDDLERDLTWLGLLGIADPPRDEVPGAIARARAAGVRTVMITGDHPLTARAIAAEIELVEGEPQVLAGGELEKLDLKQLAERAPSVDVVARATAAHKLRFIEALHEAGWPLAMTGDGVNDAPALKAATIGIAMGRGGTDVAREASDLVLADDNYATIVAAIEEGRAIFSNVQRFIHFLLAINAGLVVAVLVPALAGWPAVLTPTQILWINLITNGLPALALGMEPIHDQSQMKAPRDPGAGFISMKDALWVTGHGLWMAALALVIFRWYEPQGLKLARTLAFVVLGVGPLFHAFTARNRGRSVFSLGLFSNRPLLYAIAAGLGFQALALYVPGINQVFGAVPMTVDQVGIALAFCASVLVAGELEKLVRRLLTR